MEAIETEDATIIRIGGEYYPGLRARLGPGGRTWQVWCRYCQKWHSHSPEPGHAVAHCHVRDSPYQRTGYVLITPAQPPASD